MKINTKQFQKKVYSYYRTNKRPFPWRRTRDPYRVFVSEIMLQQTQADRVADYYTRFIKRFPVVETLARASFKSVLREWQGLGYNRRAKYLHEAAQQIVKNYKNKIPQTVTELESLPGIGPNTAASICAFAYNQPVVFIETNIRSVFIHEFFENTQKRPAFVRDYGGHSRKQKNTENTIHDQDIIPLIEQTLDTKNPREWYNALMDYGTMLKQTNPNPSRHSRHHIVQKPFLGSNREVRGALLKLLTNQGSKTKLEIEKALEFDQSRINTSLEQLVSEGLIKKVKTKFSIA